MSTIATCPFVPSRDAVLQMLEAGILAPSADNQHHVLFEIEEDGIVLRGDPGFLHCDVVHRRLLILLSYGAVVENIRLKLTEHGYSFDPKWFPDAIDPSVLIHLRWTDLHPVPSADRLVTCIVHRHTNRRFYRGPPLSPHEMGFIEMALSPQPGVDLLWCDTSSLRRTLVRMMRVAETARFQSPFLHGELFESIDFGAGWNSATSERLAPGTLGVERLLQIPFAAMRHWPVMRALNRIGVHRILGFRAGDLPARTAPHLGVLSGTGPIDAAALAVGAAFQRVWLAAESLGLALQPMVASAILTTDPDANHGVTPQTREVLLQGWKSLVGEATPFVVFRLGRAERPRLRSGRRPIESYLA